jgi:hypothetical protein
MTVIIFVSLGKQISDEGKIYFYLEIVLQLDNPPQILSQVNRTLFDLSAPQSTTDNNNKPAKEVSNDNSFVSLAL